MAAGLGFKTFTTGEVLTAGDVNGYLMQGINVFTNSTARDAAITAPAEGQFAFTKDNNSLWYYDGAAWVASGATGDIEGVTAGVGISGGGTSGTVTVTNSMATAITTAGDLIKGTGSGTFDRLGIGSTGQVLTVSGGAPSWATPGGATKNFVQIASTTLTGGVLSVTGISGYDEIWIYVRGASTNNGTSSQYIQFNTVTSGGLYNYYGQYYTGNATSPHYPIPSPWNSSGSNEVYLSSQSTTASTTSGYLRVTGCNTSGKKTFTTAAGVTAGQYQEFWNAAGFFDSSSTISSIQIGCNNGASFDAGNVLILGSA